ncbi:MAG: hypothetical protein PUC56_07685, partial [Bacteroidales bacterium]|nr:hypothetical protein [Bacteroidales bacterium]
IKKDFKYVTSPVIEQDEPIILDGDKKMTTIGPSQEINRIPVISEKPVLLVDPGDSIAELENEPAIKRSERRRS